MGIATWEHLVPRSRGGTDAPWNLALSCYPCNHRRGNAVLTKRQIRRVRAWLGESVVERIRAAHGFGARGPFNPVMSAATLGGGENV